MRLASSSAVAPSAVGIRSERRESLRERRTAASHGAALEALTEVADPAAGIDERGTFRETSRQRRFTPGAAGHRSHADGYGDASPPSVARRAGT